MAHDNYDDAFILTTEDFAPTIEELAVVEAVVGDTTLTKAIGALKKTVRSGKHMRPSLKVV